MPDFPMIQLPDRGHFGPQVQVQFERDILVAILTAAAPELSSLDQLRVEGNLDEEAMEYRIKRAAGVATNDLIRLWAALDSLNLL